MKYRAGDFSNNETRIVWDSVKESQDFLESAEELLTNQQILEQLGFNVTWILAERLRKRYECNGLVKSESVRWIEIAQYFLSEAMGQSS